jgi:ABC-type Zn2+ transport system substrate-binding protein/surface adhesin
MKKSSKEINCLLSVAGVMQFGFSATVSQASPGDNWQRQHNNQKEQKEQENQRHEREMQRHDNENARDWNNRQWMENQQHDQMVQQIEADLIVMFLNR